MGRSMSNGAGTGRETDGQGDIDRWNISWGRWIYDNLKEILRNGCPMGGTDEQGSNKETER